MRDSLPRYNIERLCRHGVEVLGGLALASGIYMAVHASYLQSEQIAGQLEIEQLNQGAIDAAIAGVAILSFAGYMRERAS